ncbi:IS5/IS1182 family transposase, partial [Pseudomonas syringae pv. tagetis]
PTSSGDKTVRLEDKIAKIKDQNKELHANEIRLNDSPDKQVTLTDPEALSMMTRGTGIEGYNLQTAVDAQHQLIVAHQV